MMNKTIFTRRLLGLVVLAAVAFGSVAVAGAGATAQEREYRASLRNYCKANFRVTKWRWNSKSKVFSCYLMGVGFNTTYVAKVWRINPAHLCSQQFGTNRWYSRYKEIYCLRR